MSDKHFHTLGDATLYTGDCLDVLETLPDQSVQTCITSPPYFGLRDYGVDGQIGLEPTPDEFVARLVEVFREVRRVLRNDGTLWLNLGDSYNAYNGNRGTNSKYAGEREKFEAAFPSGHGLGVKTLKQKDLLGIPWRVAFALQADGWYLRQDIIWHKPNPMPESVRDRCTKAHEYIFLLSKSARYYFDSEAIEEPRVSAGGPGVSGWAQGEGSHEAIAHNRDKGNARTFRGGQYVNNNKFKNSHASHRTSTGNKPPEKMTRNRRSVWTVAPRPYKEAHFATFPPDLIEPCVLAGAPAGGVVLDPFSGSGTTGQVALRYGRKYIGIELNPEYQELAIKRIKGV